MNRDAERRFVVYVLLGIPLGLVAVLVATTLTNSGYLTAYDGESHLLRAEYWARHLLPHGHLLGWFPFWFGGFDYTLTYPPLVSYILGLLTFVCPPLLALRLFFALAWFSLVPATFFILRELEADSLSAAIGATLVLMISSWFSIGLRSTYLSGLLPHMCGFTLTVILLGLQIRGSSIALQSAVLALLVLAHPFCSYWWFLASLLWILVSSREPGISALLKKQILIYMFGGLLSAFWLVPFLLNSPTMANLNAFGDQDRRAMMLHLLTLRDAGGKPFAVLAGVGLLSLLIERRFKVFAFLFLSIALSFLLTLGFVRLPLGDTVNSSQVVRFEGFFLWLALLPVAFLLARLGRFFPEKFRIPLMLLLGLSAGAYVEAHTLLPECTNIRMLNDEAPAEVKRVVQFLKTRVKPGEFILTENSWKAIESYGSPHFLAQRVQRESDNTLWDMDGGFPESIAGAKWLHRLSRELPASVRTPGLEAFVRARGIRYIVPNVAETIQALGDVDWLQPIYQSDIISRPAWRSDSIAIFEVKDFDSPFGLPPDAGRNLKSVEFQSPGRYRLTFQPPVDLPANTTVALNYHPWLHAVANGAPVKSVAGPNALYDLEPELKRVSTLEFIYNRPGVTDLFTWLSLLAWLALAGFGILTIKNRLARTRS